MDERVIKYLIGHWALLVNGVVHKKCNGLGCGIVNSHFQIHLFVFYDLSTLGECLYVYCLSGNDCECGNDRLMVGTLQNTDKV